LQLYIEDQRINQSELLSWANSTVKTADRAWVVDIAGSTGVPKLISHSKESMKRSAMKTGAYFSLEQGQSALLCMPARYIAGKMMIIRALVLDLDLICVKPSSRPLQEINRAIDFVAMTPMQMQASLEHGDVGNVRIIILGGAPVSNNLAQKFQELSTACFLTYGMTETITHIAVRKLNGEKRTDYFEALQGVQFESEAGRLIIYADHIDASPINTTDEVELLDNSRFRWLGRTDHVINSGGLKIHPEQVEAELKPFIDQRFIITSRPDERLGQQVIIVVEGRRIEQSILNKAFDCITNKYWKPKKVLYVDEFEMTGSGKIVRKK